MQLHAAPTKLLPFCGGVALHLRQDADKARVLRELDARYGVQPQQRAGRARVIRLADWRGGELPNAGGHWACALGGGAPTLMVLCRGGGPTDAGMCVLVSRRTAPGEFYPRVVLLHLRFADAAFDGTVLDGEVLRPEGGAAGPWRFAAHDLLAHAGQPVATLPLAERQGRLAHLLAAQHQPTSHDLLAVCQKRVVPCADARRMLQQQQSAAGGGALPASWRALLLMPARAGRCTVVLLGAGAGAGAGAAGGGRQGAGRPGEAEAEAEAEAGLSADAQDESEAEAEAEDEAGPPPRDFWIRATHLPDVYELHADRESAARSAGDGEGGLAGADGGPMTAGVPSLHASRQLAAAVRAAGGSVARARLRFSRRFRRWVLADDGA